VKYPYARGVLLEMYREAKQRLGDPVLAWADVINDPERRRRYHQARGKGGLVRVSWAEAVEMIAAAQVHTIKTYGPDRIAGFSPNSSNVHGFSLRRNPLHSAHRRRDDVVL
jgi:nitrate reductase / nitrite oxidoreductase, alpha subunit